jgi:signal transducing adaptor molecule
VLEFSIQDKRAQELERVLTCVIKRCRCLRLTSEHTNKHSSSACLSASSTPSAAAAVARQQAYTTGFVPSTKTRPQTHTQPQTTAYVTTAEPSPQSTAAVPSPPTPSATEAYTVTHVRALHSFGPTEPNELAFEKGDIVKVVNREYGEGRLGAAQEFFRSILSYVMTNLQPYLQHTYAFGGV